MPYKNPEDAKACRLRNNHKKLAYMKRYSASHKQQKRDYGMKYRAKNKLKIAANLRAYAKAKPHKNKAAVAKYLAKKRLDPAWLAMRAEKTRARWKANPEGMRAHSREYQKRKYETDVNHLIKCRLRSRLTKKLKCQKAQKATNTMALTGCTGDFLRGYLEARFTEGMTWKNVHIDHVIPLAEFDLRDPDQQRQAFHYSNLKPMFAVANMKKGAKCPPTHQAELI